jgi:hypothetical protein
MAYYVYILYPASLYQYLPPAMKKEIPALTFNDSQFNTIARDYYMDDSFCRDSSGEINLWKLYGLFTGSNKSSYIDSFLGRSLNAYQFTESLVDAFDHNNGESWFLS